MFRRLTGPPFENEAYGELTFREGAEVYEGDLYSHEIRRLLATVCETGEFMRPERKVLLFAHSISPQLAPAGAIHELLAIEGLRLEWVETYARSLLRRIVDGALGCIGGYSVDGRDAACYAVETQAALVSERLEFAHFYELTIVSLPDTGSVGDLVQRVREKGTLEDEFELDPSYALAKAWYDDRPRFHAAHERKRRNLEMTTNFLCGPACSPAIRSAVSRFAASVP